MRRFVQVITLHDLAGIIGIEIFEVKVDFEVKDLPQGVVIKALR